MSAETLSNEQRGTLWLATCALWRGSEAESELAEHVRELRRQGVPILYLADALGVSRSRIRVLAREQS